MYKKIVIIITILLLTGCNKKNSITTIIENKKNYKIGINYPITNTSLDKKVKDDIDNIYNNFKKKDKNELNIDYIYNSFNNYISLCLKIYESNEKEYIITYFYDKKKNTLLKIYDITDDIDLINDVTNYSSLDKFIIDNNYLTIYADKKHKIKLVDINLKISLKKEKIKYTSYVENRNIINPNDKFIALTFDDGPSKYTDDLIEYLYKENCPSTFFITGNKVKLYNELLSKSLGYGNEIGNHSYNHKWLAKLNKEDYIKQINDTQNIIKKYTGYTPLIFRPTYGGINKMIRDNTNLDIILWNVDTMDWKYKNSNIIVKRATKNLKDGNIILMHDTHKQTINAVKKIVPIIKENGFKCITISDMKEVNYLRKKNE